MDQEWQEAGALAQGEGLCSEEDWQGVRDRVYFWARYADVPAAEVAKAVAVVTSAGLSAGVAASGIRTLIEDFHEPMERAARAAHSIGLPPLRDLLRDRGLLGACAAVHSSSGGRLHSWVEIAGSVDAVAVGRLLGPVS